MKPHLSLTFILSILMASGQSVLSQGEWIKIGITQEGIYKLDHSFMTDAGIPSTVDPKTIKLYSHGFRGTLPQANAVQRSFDPVEVAMLGIGTNDQSLDQGDYFLFYGQGPHKLLFDAEGNLDYEHNIYSDTLYLLMTYGGKAGKRIQTRATLPTTAETKSTYQKLIVYEKDEYNQLGSGRRWLSTGVTRSNPIMDFSYNVANATGPVDLWTSLAADSQRPCSFDVLINGEELGRVNIDSVSGASYSQKQKYSEGFFSTSISSSSLDLRLRFNHGAGSSKGFLDYFILGVTSNFSDDQDIIKLAPGTSSSWEIGDNQLVWNITSVTSPEAIPNESGKFTNNTTESALAVFNPESALEPKLVGKVANQNIKSLANAEAIIVTHPLFLTQANRLAQFHQSYDQMNVGVVTVQQVYNEFSAGSQDITAIRDFLRYCYLNGGNLKYALLFGDASYDYKNRVANNTNFVPIYESRESAHNIFSHSSDDYFGFMEEDEGYWSEGKLRNNGQSYDEPYEDHTLEIGIGRLTAKTKEEAQHIVDKIIRYKTAKQTLGKWKQQIAYLVDDGDNNEHMRQAEYFSGIVNDNYYAYNAKKLYLDRYDQDVDPGPDSPITRDVTNTLKDGVFLFNYIGHGNEFQLTSLNELAIDLDVIRSLSNRHKLPLFVTATCEFGKYDNPIRDSGAELLLSHDNGGAIALVTTTRPVYAHTNEPVNVALHENLFAKIDGEHPRLGDVMKNAKNQSLSGPINRNFALLGDPMLRLNYPGYDITMDQFQQQADTLSALEVFRISGAIMDGATLMESFNGTATVTIWDIPQTKITKGDESDPYTFEEQTNALYRGEFSVVNGLYDTEIILPKNISYKYQPGKITLYASDKTNFMDAKGSTKNFVLGGTSSNLAEDSTPPEINLYLNEPDFNSGGTVGRSSLFIAELTDENGINISSNGFSQGITLQLNNEETIEVNEFYTAEMNTYKKGYVVYPLQNLEPGKYTATLKVSDTYNNFTESTVEFKVSDKPVLKIYNALNYPNPVNTNRLTTFSFEHDREDEKLEVDLALYNLQGRVVNQWDYTIDSSPRKIDYLTLRLSNFQGSDLEKGIYLYRLRVSSTLDGASNEIVKRLVIIN
ncbi:type IX secretion system sortase PorU [Marinoscillum sp.]|uniref:type IX secretion system sortase PorU n=1 Tax=Marinoscillum sp. TaxID=2024838 RepID=UPI003BAD9307